MWPLIFMCTFVTTSAINSNTFRKCCPSGQSLIKVSGLDGDEYKCIDSIDSVSERTTDTNFPTSTFFMSDGVNVEYGMPKDCVLRMLQIDENVIQLSDNGNHCYERLVLEMINGTKKQIIPKTVGLVCNESDISSGTDVKIQNIRKCCPPGQMYDGVAHQCMSIEGDVDTFREHQWFVKQLKAYGGKVFEFENGLNCKSVEYDVQLRDEMYALSLEGSTLKIVSRIEGGAVLSPVGNWCVDREFRSRRPVARVCTADCGTFGAFCMKKCCPIGQHYRPLHCGSTRSACVLSTNNDTFFDVSEYVDPIKEDFSIGDVLGFGMEIKCPVGKVVLNKSQAHDAHRLTADGRLSSNLGVDSDYCLEMFDWRHCGQPPLITAVVCYKAIEPQVKNFKLSFVLISISCVCLALTLLVYCFIAELRNLHGRNLICHVSTMLLAFACLARVQYQYVADKNLCAALGYGIYFGFVAAFVWLNVMCFDIWWTFGSVRTVQPLHKGRATRRRFLWYSLYAWGVAVSLTLAMFLLDRYPVAAVLDANMGVDMCWFGSIQNSHEDWPHYIFFVIPMGVVTSINFVLWLLTARHCARVKSEVHRLQAGSVGDRAKRSFRVDKANFVLTGKLWIVMGAGWSTELLSTLVLANTAGWFVTILDMVNELQGVFIFIILIFKPKLYYLIRKRLGLEKPDAQKNGQSSTARTSSTFLSRTISSDERAHTRVSVPNENPKQI